MFSVFVKNNSPWHGKGRVNSTIFSTNGAESFVKFCTFRNCWRWRNRKCHQIRIIIFLIPPLYELQEERTELERSRQSSLYQLNSIARMKTAIFEFLQYFWDRGNFLSSRIRQCSREHVINRCWIMSSWTQVKNVIEKGRKFTDVVIYR